MGVVISWALRSRMYVKIAEDGVKNSNVALKHAMRFTIPLRICSCTLATVREGNPVCCIGGDRTHL